MERWAHGWGRLVHSTYALSGKEYCCKSSRHNHYYHKKVKSQRQVKAYRIELWTFVFGLLTSLEREGFPRVGHARADQG